MDIPVTFHFNDKTHIGILSEVSGGGSVGHTKWFLMVDKYYWGTLLIAGGEFVFHSPSKSGLDNLTDYFAGVVIGWYC